MGRGKWQWAEERRIREGEDRAVGANPQRQRECRNRRKARECSHLPKRRYDIGAQLLDELSQAHLSISLSADIDARPFQQADVTKPREHHFAGDARIHTALDQFARAHLDMEFETLCGSVFRVPCSTFVFEVLVQRSGFYVPGSLEPRT